MGSKKENIERLEKALRVAHHSRTAPGFSPDWRQRVMHDIRALDVGATIEDHGILGTLSFRKTVLPFASATALAAVALLFFASNIIPGLEYDILEFLLEDATGLFSQPLLDF